MFTKYFDFDPIRGRVHVLYLACFLENMFTAPKLKARIINPDKSTILD